MVGKAETPKKTNSCLWKKEIMILENPSTNKLKQKPKSAAKNAFKKID